MPADFRLVSITCLVDACQSLGLVHDLEPFANAYTSLELDTAPVIALLQRGWTPTTHFGESGWVVLRPPAGDEVEVLPPRTITGKTGYPFLVFDSDKKLCRQGSFFTDIDPANCWQKFLAHWKTVEQPNGKYRYVVFPSLGIPRMVVLT